MWKLMLGLQLIADWDHEIFYDQSQLAWFVNNVWYSDPNHEMHVEYTPETADGGPDVIA